MYVPLQPENSLPASACRTLKYLWPFLGFCTFFGAYLYFYGNIKYSIVVNEKIVNFTGVEDFIPPFVDFDHIFFVAPDRKLLGCGIPKSMSQLMSNVMCFLYNEKQYLAHHNSLNDTWTTERECLKEDQFRNPTAELLKDPDLVRFAFIRDPIHRFISLYLDKCIYTDSCYDCGTNMTCFVQRIYETLNRIKGNRKSLHVFSSIEQHVAPLSWYCNFNEHIKKYSLLMMGADLEERRSSILHLANILKRQGFSEKTVEKIQNDALGGETAHSTHKSSHRLEAERQVREDPVVRDLLHKIYLFDYVVFPFKRDQLDTKYQTDFWETSNF